MPSHRPLRNLCLVAALSASGVFGGCATRTPHDAKPFSWMTGAWVTGPDEGNRTMEEYWAPPADNAMIGMNRALEDNLMVAFEYLQIVEKRDGGYEFLASPDGRHPPTVFTLTDLSDEHAVFENPEHDFPRRVIYRRLDRSRLLARIEGSVDGETRSMEWRYQMQERSHGR